MAEKLTEAQRLAMKRIRDGRSPFIRGINNPSGHAMMERLERRGLVDRRADLAWTLTAKGEEALGS